MIRFALVLVMQHAFASSLMGDNVMEMTGSASSISTDAWIVTGFDSSFEFTDAGLSGEFQVASIALLESDQVFENIRVSCASIEMTSRSVQCKQGTFELPLPGIGRQSIPGGFTYDHDSGTALVELDGVAVAGGQVRCTITASDDLVDVRYSGSKLQMSDLLGVAATLSNALSGYSMSGLATLSGTFRASSGAPPRIAFIADLTDVSLANEAGTIAADGVAGQLGLDVILQEDTTQFSLHFDGTQGEAYLEPVYANFSASAFSLRAENVATPDFSAFSVPLFRLRQQGLLDVSGEAVLQLPTADRATTGITAAVELQHSSIANLYENFGKVAAAGTVLSDLETDGSLSGTVSIVDGAPRSVQVQLEDAIFDDRRGRFALYGVDGTVSWNADGEHNEEHEAQISQLSWTSGTVHSIVVGGGVARMRLANNDVELLAPLRLPMLGGALMINQLAMSNFGDDDATGTLDAHLEPVQLGQLTGAFGWPAFSGTLSGSLPLMQLAENTVTVGGTLNARLFDGTLEVSELQIEQPFGLVPRLHAEVAVRDLDLQRLTEAFSFGLIQGKLSGDVRGLMMENWHPVAMNTRFYTPDDDRSQHRISQRAVENLASVGGGGAAAVLSTGFLKFFDVFAYDQIGLRCVLQDGVCQMSGVGPAKSGPQGNGYYLVKGSGIPRIDVVGFRDQVSWTRLVQQLTAITQSGSPNID